MTRISMLLVAVLLGGCDASETGAVADSEDVAAASVQGNRAANTETVATEEDCELLCDSQGNCARACDERAHCEVKCASTGLCATVCDVSAR